MQWTAALSEKNTHITTLDAMLDLGILRLASRISELKKAGVPIR
ncbi:MAG: helix-turn-helix domain-containing protein, partial [Christensenellales bacterium]